MKGMTVFDTIRVFRFFKLVALASAIFLLSSNLDNIPDCPEALNTGSKSFVSMQFTPLHAGCVMAAAACDETLTTPAIGIQYVLEVSPHFSQAPISPLLRQAADSSPPAA
jgi:hypothetical protein